MALFDPPFTSQRRAVLRAGALSAIWHSHALTGHLPRKAGSSAFPPEEDFVASFILSGLSHLAHAWSPILNRWNLHLSLTGVFCHQTPKAVFNFNGKSIGPELADLLMVRRHTNASGVVQQTASLVQAKMSSDASLSLGNDDAQLHLLTSWPTFKLRATNAPTQDFNLGIVPRQACYATIDKTFRYPEQNTDWPDGCQWATMPPAQSCEPEKSFAAFLTDMLVFDEGRPFMDVPPANDDWSVLINFLLTTTFSMPLRTRDYRTTEPRGSTFALNRAAYHFASHGDAVSLVNAEMAAQFRPSTDGPTDGEDREFAEGGQGRIVIFETKEIEATSRRD